MTQDLLVKGFFMYRFHSHHVIIALLVSCITSADAGLSFDFSRSSQANSWAHDIFIGREQPRGGSLEFLPSRDMYNLHSTTRGNLFSKNNAHGSTKVLSRLLSYQHAFGSGWYVGVNAMPIIRLVRLSLGYDVKLTADGLCFGRYFGSGPKLLGKAEVFTTKGFLGLRSALQYQLIGKGRFFINANHALGLATLPATNRFLRFGEMVGQWRAPACVTAEMYNGLRMGYGVLSIGGGHRGEYRDAYDFVDMPLQARETDQSAFYHAQYSAVSSASERDVLDGVKLGKKSLFKQRCIADVTLALKRFSLSVYCNSVFARRPVDRIGVRCGFIF